MGKGFPTETPNPSFTTARVDAATAVITSAAEVAVGTAPAIKGGDVPKKIDLSCQINPDATPQVLTFRLYKDNVVLGTETFRQGFQTATDPETLTMHWVDPSPGKGTPVYQARAISTVVGTLTASNRRITVYNL